MWSGLTGGIDHLLSHFLPGPDPRYTRTTASLEVNDSREKSNRILTPFQFGHTLAIGQSPRQSTGFFELS